jgi:hypothetical protein
MTVRISERSFEEAIECTLLQYGPDACAGDPTAVRETAAALRRHSAGCLARRCGGRPLAVPELDGVNLMWSV